MSPVAKGKTLERSESGANPLAEWAMGPYRVVINTIIWIDGIPQYLFCYGIIMLKGYRMRLMLKDQTKCIAREVRWIDQRITYKQAIQKRIRMQQLLQGTNQ